MAWGWDPRARRYRDSSTGRFLPRSEALTFAQSSLDASGIASDQLASFVANGYLSPADFGALFREELKHEVIRLYLLGIGGRLQMTFADWGSIGGMLGEQYRYLPGFEDAIAAGELTEAQIQARARMYVNSAREGFEKAKGKNALALGMQDELWVLGFSEHCDDCLYFAGMGWQPIGTFPVPGSGQTACLTACQCVKAYRNPETGKEY